MHVRMRHPRPDLADRDVDIRAETAHWRVGWRRVDTSPPAAQPAPQAPQPEQETAESADRPAARVRRTTTPASSEEAD